MQVNDQHNPVILEVLRENLHASVHTVHNMGIFVMRSGAHIRHRGKIAAEIAERVTEIPDHQNHRFFSSNFFF